MKSNLIVVHAEQVLAFLLAAIPVAERMLLYNLVMAAWLLLPQRGNG